MIFMHKETGSIYELMIKTLQDYFEYSTSGSITYRVGEVVMFGETIPVVSDFANDFEFIGFL